MEPTTVQGAIERYEPDQLVVAIPDLALVQGELGRLGVYCVQEDPDDGLGLALLTLQNVAGSPVLRSDDTLVGRVYQAKWHGTPPPGAEISDLDLLIYKLREGFSSEYRGWVPTMGKNRVIAPVRGLPYVGGGGEGDPAPSDGAGNVRMSGPLRGSGPQPWLLPRPTRPGRGVRIGLLDTQLYPNKWLDGGYVAAAGDLLPASAASSSPPPASEGHATFVAGLILNRAPAAQLDVRRVLDTRALGKVWDVAKIMADFVGSGVDILNLSFGCYTDDGEPPMVLERAVSLVSPQILLVAAAGNHGDIDALKASHSPQARPWTWDLTPKTPVWPAAFANVVAVGATDRGKLAAFSPNLPWVDVTAPGVGVESTYLTGQVELEFPDPGCSPTRLFPFGFATWTGTSFAAAGVTGAVAAEIEPGRQDARRALREVLEAPQGDIRRFEKS